MRTLLVATDLSSRSDRAVRRAAMLALERSARLLILHVVDDDQPRPMVEAGTVQASRWLREEAGELAEAGEICPEILVRAGDAFATILEVADQRSPELLVMGIHRRQLLRDIFVGTTVERVVRLSRRPVLAVSQPARRRYGNVLVAIDISEATAGAVRTARSLGFLGPGGVTVVHAFQPVSRMMLHQTGVLPEVAEADVAHATRLASQELVAFMAKPDLDLRPDDLVLEAGDAIDVIRLAVRRKQPDLLVVGTHGRSGVGKLLLGSVAERVLSEIECDVLAVPPAPSP